MGVRLVREVRFSLGPERETARPAGNGWAGAPGSDALAPYLTLQAAVAGPVDPRTGYLCNIKVLDRILRDRAVDGLRRAAADPARQSRVAEELVRMYPVVASDVPPPAVLDALTLGVTPYLFFSVKPGDPRMVCMTYSFEFSAAHRLYIPDMTDAENQRVFGRCTNANGHGHNYVVQVTLKGEPDPTTGAIIHLGQCDRIVKEAVIDRFDHKHLNLDCPEFASLNPTVENITRVVFDRLKAAFAPVRLERVRVYETPKTFAEYAEG